MTDGLKKTNYHTHSTFCDGNATVEEMVLSAIEKKFDIIGFSSHSMFPFGGDCHIAPRGHEAYVKEVRRVAELYKNKIEVYCGFEADYIRCICMPSFEQYNSLKPDYLIGSVHYVLGDRGYFEADGSPTSKVLAGIRNYFNGDEKKAVQTYFAEQREMLSHGNFTFWGHPDLIRKQNGKRILFDEHALWYKRELKATAKAAARAGVCAEINTGGMARGYLDTPYPSPEFLQILHDYNVPVTINSDSHAPGTLDFWFPEAIEYAKKAGYTELMFYSAGSLHSQKI